MIDDWKSEIQEFWDKNSFCMVMMAFLVGCAGLVYLLLALIGGFVPFANSPWTPWARIGAVALVVVIAMGKAVRRR